MASDMHVVCRRIGAQQMIKHRGNVEAAVDQPGHHRVDFAIEQHQVAHCHRFAVGRLERDPPPQRQGGLDGDAVQRHGKIAAREAIAVHVAHYRRLTAESVVDFLPVDFLGVAGGNRRRE